MMSLGHGRQIVVVEVVKDATTAIALIATVFTLSLETLVWGQLASTIVTWIIAGIITSRTTGYKTRSLLSDLLPFAFSAVIAASAIWLVPIPYGNIEHELNLTSLAALCIQAATGAAATLIILTILRVPELPEALAYIRKRRNI